MKTPAALRIEELPALKSPLAGGTYVGVTTLPDGQLVAVIALAWSDKRLTWKAAGTWAKKAGGEQPTRAVTALLYHVAKDLFEPAYYWTSEEYSASGAWRCGFDDGDQYVSNKSFEARAVAVRTIPLAAQSFNPSVAQAA